MGEASTGTRLFLCAPLRLDGGNLFNALLSLQAGKRNDVSDSYAKALVELAEEASSSCFVQQQQHRCKRCLQRASCSSLR